MIQFSCCWSLLLLHCVISSHCCCFLSADALSLPSDHPSPFLQPDLLNFKKGWLTKQYEDGQVSLGVALPFASVFSAVVGPSFCQRTLTQASRLCMGLLSALRCLCGLEQYWTVILMGETRCRSLGRAATGNLYDSGARQPVVVCKRCLSWSKNSWCSVPGRFQSPTAGYCVMGF